MGHGSAVGQIVFNFINDINDGIKLAFMVLGAVDNTSHLVGLPFEKTS